MFFLPAVFAVSLCGCSFLQTQKDGTVSFRFDGRSLSQEEKDSLRLLVSINGDYEDHLSFSSLNDTVAEFRGVPVGAVIHVSAYVYAELAVETENGFGTKKEFIYGGKTEDFEVLAGINETDLSLRKYLKVVFCSDGSEKTEYVLAGDKVPEPSVPSTKTGDDDIAYAFAGWFISTDGGVTLLDKFDFYSPVSSDVMLYEKRLQMYDAGFAISVAVDDSSDIEVTRTEQTVEDSREYVFTADDSYQSYLWKLDGEDKNADGSPLSDTNVFKFSLK
ncbi:MAG: InlB B-repeat-containing protein, partial [Treponema sp.]|nr:InlB B-repeat-containing protein [Treponema sp.]